MGFFGQWKKNLTKSSELKELFSSVGINFMHLHPTIHKAVLQEAILKDDSKAAFARFLKISELAGESDLTNEGKKNVMISAYQELSVKLEEHLRKQA